MVHIDAPKICLISHAIYMTQPFTFLCTLIPIISCGRNKLWSYTLCSFFQFPITSSHKSLQPDQHCSQTQSTVLPQCHRTRVTPTAVKILHKHTRVYTAITGFLKAGRRAKYCEATVCNSQNVFPLNFFTCQSLVLKANP